MIKVIAFYLPQFHPIKENDAWFGNGFTEWTSVGKAKPLFKGHYQPRVPKDLGYYDLRLPEVREAQADMAKEAGVSAFCYYHYWFGEKKQLLERPLKEVVNLGKPDFPFCLCWANHSWYKKNWNPDTGVLEQNLLLKQKYGGRSDYEEHFYELLPIFRDERYLRVDGRLFFMIYRAFDIPDFNEFRNTWNSLAIKNNLPQFYFVANMEFSNEDMLNNSLYSNFDALTLNMLNNIEKGKNRILGGINRKIKRLLSAIFRYPMSVYDYKSITDRLVSPLFSDKRVYPVVIPNWDYTPRRGTGGLILKKSTPEYFKKYIQKVFRMVSQKDERDQIVFLKSWNEWGEGNYMEPDLKFGKGYIKALKEALEEI